MTRKQKIARRKRQDCPTGIDREGGFSRIDVFFPPEMPTLDRWGGCQVENVAYGDGVSTFSPTVLHVFYFWYREWRAGSSSVWKSIIILPGMWLDMSCGIQRDMDEDLSQLLGVAAS